MSNSEDSLHDTDDEAFIANFFPSDCNTSNKKNRSGLVLKSKENIYKQKQKCSKILKKKLKKYKLRKNCQEDPAIIDVSKSLSSRLRIESQYNLNNNNYKGSENIDEWTINYLTKMAKKTSKFKRTNIQNVSAVIDEDKNKCSKHSVVKINSGDENKMKEINNIDSKIKKKIKCGLNKSDESGSGQNSSEDNNQVSDAIQMNAFMIMMGARNKSIGSNSPGKEKVLDLKEDDKVKKSLKLKRTIALEKMAIAKGSKSNKESEEIRTETIKIKMEERAQRFKKMIGKVKTQSSQCDNNLNTINKTHDHDSKKRSKQSNGSVASKAKRFKTNEENFVEEDVIIVDSDENNDIISVSGKHINDLDTTKVNGIRLVKSNSDSGLSKSDIEFIKKLSPPIKKKESMLSYYDKIEKNKDEEDKPISDNVLKVKFTLKNKIKLRKKKSRENKEGSCVTDLNKKEGAIDIYEKPNKGKKEKHSLKDKGKNCLGHHSNIKSTVEECDSENNQESNLNKKGPNLSTTSIKLIESDVSLIDETDKSSESIERRSKRVTRKPIKYQDIVDSSSDDDEMTITEKLKKTKNTPLPNLRIKKSSRISTQNVSEENPDESYLKSNNESSSSTKLAPIFSPKPQISKADLEAKQKFLQSGIPDQLKKIIEKQKNIEMENDHFQNVFHVQQKNSNNMDYLNPWNLKPVDLGLSDESSILTNDSDDKIKYECVSLKFERLPEKNNDLVVKSCNKERLNEMKISYPKFPVYKIFKTLKTKQIPQETQSSLNSNTDAANTNHDIINNLLETKVDDPKTTIWCEKFRPISTSDIIGNFDAVNSLKVWLTKWKESNLDHQRQHTRSYSSDSSDFYYPSDSDSRDSQKSYNNVLIVTGPSGSGKTSAIYAVASELFIKVIEVNTSTKRTGKVILANLQEATQSHKVNRETTSAENSQNSQEVTRPHKTKKNKYLKTYSKLYKNKEKTREENADGQDSQGNKENNKTAMSLILVEDADLVFEQDDGFVSALNQIVQTSKRPVIMITSSLHCSHLQRFITKANVVKFHQLSPKMLGMWLDLMCLVENGDILNNMGQSLLEFYRGDIRKAINILQFWVGSSNSNLTDPNLEQSLPKTDSQDRQGNDDECSSISWSDQDVPLASKQVITKQDTTQINNSLFKTFITVHDHDIGIRSSVLQFPVNHMNIWWNVPKLFSIENDNSDSKNSDKNKMKSFAKLIDSLSVSDVILAKMTPELDVSVISSDWQSKIGDGASESVNMASYNRSVGLSDSMSYALLTSSINSTRQVFKIDEENLSVDYTLPGFTQLRSEEKLASRHNAIYDGLPLTCRLDRRAISMDYFSTCRDICRTEKDKNDNNTKRNNRFCHYMRSMKVDCAGETLDLLCDSLV